MAPSNGACALIALQPSHHWRNKMIHEQELVADFHKAFDIPSNDIPTNPDNSVKIRRLNLIAEEVCELFDAIVENDLVKVADGLADVLYVVYGTAVEYGIDLDPVFEEVHRSNMTKIGGEKREDGKVLKPENFSPPDIANIIKQQILGGH
jgi:predicted HAD superfamily Cof-like phosphohydrolase